MTYLKKIMCSSLSGTANPLIILNWKLNYLAKISKSSADPLNL
jgi:hypothetical protein